jgi:hypothetical protein
MKKKARENLLKNSFKFGAGNLEKPILIRSKPKPKLNDVSP